MEILEAAAQVIAERGFHGMSMRELARATKRGLATYYNYFTSKEDVLFDIQSRAFETLIETASTSLTSAGDPSSRLYAFVANHVRYFVEHRAVMRVLIHEAASLSPERRRAVRRLKQRYFAIGKEVVVELVGMERRKSTDAGISATKRSASRDGERGFDAAEVERATYVLFGMLNWTYGWYDPKSHGSLADVTRTIHRIAASGMLASGDRSSSRSALEERLHGQATPDPLDLRSTAPIRLNAVTRRRAPSRDEATRRARGKKGAIRS